MLIGSLLQLDGQNPKSNPDRNQSFNLKAAPVSSRLNWEGWFLAGCSWCDPPSSSSSSLC